MKRTEVYWENVSLVSSEDTVDIEQLFCLEAEEYLQINAGRGLGYYAVLDKCINILLDFIEMSLIKSCHDVYLEQNEGDYTFYFSYILPESSEKIYVSVVMEVLE